MSIDRTELERLLADRPTGSRSAMQAVRESYGDIGLMRERGLSWAEISDLLAKLGITARDNQPISPVTLRSAFFLVGNEGRGDESAPAEVATGAPEALEAVHRAALGAGRTGPGPLDFDPPQAVPEISREEGAPDADAGDGDGHGDDHLPAYEEPIPEEPAPEEPSSVAPADKYQAIEFEGFESGAAGSDRYEDEERSDTVVETGPEPTAELPSEPAAAEVAETALPIPAIPAEPVESVPTQATVPPPTLSPDETTNVTWKGDRMLGTIFVLNDRGGVGKTLLSHHLMATAMLEGLQLKVVEYEVNERLARLFGPEMVEHRKITQDFMNMMGSGDGFYEFWDLIGPELQRGGRLYDFGGNISQWFFNWAEVSGFDYYVGDGERLTFMVPVTVDLASLSTGMATLERIATIAPKAKRVLVENGVSGPFSQLEDSQYARRKAEMVEREGVHVLSMSPCTAPAWARLTGHRLDQVASMTREDLVKLGMTPPVASRSLIIIHEWLRNMRQALSPYLHDAFRQSPALKAGVR